MGNAWHHFIYFLSHTVKPEKWFLTNLIWAVVIWVMAIILLRIIRAFINRILYNRQLQARLIDERRAKTLSTLLNSMARYGVYFLTIITILDKFKLPVTSFLTAAGIGGIALAFGAQNLVRDVLTGFFLIFEDQYAVGDMITIAGITGTAEEMTLRVTKVRDPGGQLHIIPNGKIDQVTNHMGGSMRAMIDIPVAYEANLSKAEEVLTEEFSRFRKDCPDLVDGPTLLGVEDLSGRGIILRVLARTAPLKQWDVERELRKRIKIAFDLADIPLAIPRRLTLRWTPGKGRNNH